MRRAVRRDRPFAVLTEYALLSKSLLGLPAAVRKIIDTNELFFRNPERFEVDGLAAPVVCTPTSERIALGRADILVAIQKNDARSLKELFPATQVITVSHTYPQLQRTPDQLAPGTILYVGSSNPFNVHGLQQFISYALDRILQSVPAATLRVVGSVPSIPGLQTKRIVYVGRVTDQQLAAEYHTAHVVINPQVAGTGLKIKCVEALSAGCPLVMNRAGADGLEDAEGQAFLVAANWREFADHVIELLTDDRRRLALESEARAFANRVFSPAAAFSELAAALAPPRSAV